MRRILPLLLGSLALLALLACSGSPRNERETVVVSIYPYELLVRQLTGDSLNVVTLIPPNSSPHTFSPKPAGLRALNGAALAVSNGFGLETNLGQAFDALGDRHVKIEDQLRRQHVIPADETNPHIWLSPRLLTHITLILSDQLQTRFPHLKTTISENTGRLISDLAALHQRMQSERGTFTRTPVVTWHDSFHYLLKDYDIEDLGTVQSSPGKEPTPRELARIGSLVKSHRLKAVYTEVQMSDKAARALASEFDLSIVQLDPLGHSFKPKSIMDVILNNWEGLKLGWE